MLNVQIPKHKERFWSLLCALMWSAQKQSNSRLLTIISLFRFFYKNHGKTSSRSHQKASTQATATHNRTPSEFAFSGEKIFALFSKI